jgi:hypothetical protein
VFWPIKFTRIGDKQTNGAIEQGRAQLEEEDSPHVFIEICVSFRAHEKNQRNKQTFGSLTALTEQANLASVYHSTLFRH